MKKTRLSMSVLTMLLLVGFIFATLSVSAADKDSNAKHSANLIEKQGVIIDGRLGIQDQNKELAKSQVGTVVTILNWAHCVSAAGTKVSSSLRKFSQRPYPASL
ncbi:MAG: hypothetical protein FD169_1202 [Bacillota bacterium]|nr:MAG: hypothetical protein FD169_1202 [Bacillota bacterium]MBS3949134.1 hypothetical protein [Peptococcaceae bacterium]